MILVTGATGLVGSHLIFKLVSSGKKIRALKLPESDYGVTKRVFQYYSSEADKLFNQIEWVEGDVIDVCSINDAMMDIEYVYHCAAVVSFHSLDKKKVMKVNVEGTANIVNMALEHGIKKLCHVSSVAAFGKGHVQKQIDETTEWKESVHNSVYAISKHSGEQEVWRAVAEGLKAVIVNPTIIIGPGEWGKSSTNLFNIVWNGLKYYSLGVNGYIDVRDVSDIMIHLMEGSIENEHFILCAENISYQDFFNLTSEYLKKPKPYIEATPFMGELAWRIEDIKSKITGKKPFITKESARSANQKFYYANTKVVKALGYSFIPIEQSIKETAQLFLKDHLTNK